jgi:hypothetical protein
MSGVGDTPDTLNTDNTDNTDNTPDATNTLNTPSTHDNIDGASDHWPSAADLYIKGIYDRCGRASSTRGCDDCECDSGYDRDYNIETIDRPKTPEMTPTPAPLPCRSTTPDVLCDIQTTVGVIEDRVDRVERIVRDLSLREDCTTIIEMVASLTNDVAELRHELRAAMSKFEI